MSRQKSAAPPTGPSQRQLKAGELIRHALVEILAREDWRDPLLAGQKITVSEVRISPDFKHATVFCSALGGADSAKIAEGLKHVQSFLRARLAKMIVLRAIPQLSFQPDGSFDEADRIGQLLRDPRVARDLVNPLAAPVDDEEKP